MPEKLYIKLKQGAHRGSSIKSTKSTNSMDEWRTKGN
jgi:hypothetical protein